MTEPRRIPRRTFLELCGAGAGAAAVYLLGCRGGSGDFEPEVTDVANPLADYPAPVPVVERHRVAYVTSGAALVELRSRGPSKAPRPLLRLLGSDGAGSATTEDGLRGVLLEDYRIVHVEAPLLELSAIELAPSAGEETGDGLLEVSEVSSLPRLDADLLVLAPRPGSAAESGVEVPSNPLPPRGDALGEAFLAQGARAVLLPLWEVPAEDRTRLLGRFYEGLERGASAAEALRAAKSSLLREPEASRSRSWASLVLFGEAD